MCRVTCRAQTQGINSLCHVTGVSMASVSCVLHCGLSHLNSRPVFSCLRHWLKVCCCCFQSTSSRPANLNHQWIVRQETGFSQSSTEFFGVAENACMCPLPVLLYLALNLCLYDCWWCYQSAWLIPSYLDCGKSVCALVCFEQQFSSCLHFLVSAAAQGGCSFVQEFLETHLEKYEFCNNWILSWACWQCHPVGTARPVVALLHKSPTEVSCKTCLAALPQRAVVFLMR